MKTKHIGAIVTGVIFLFVAVLVVGISLRRDKAKQADFISQTEPVEIQPPMPTVSGDTENEKMSREDREFLAWLDEEIEKSEETVPRMEEPPPEPPQNRRGFAGMQSLRSFMEGLSPQEAQNLPQWQRVWTDLNLSQEEQFRLQEGFVLIWQKWLTMSDEERVAERERLAEMRIRWEGMSEQERTQASLRMRDRFDQWRESGQTELPPLTLD
ncbi:MAG: hypothetical protein JW828_12105 [Sedimentisphaerales bacterium]|nr:hypothetical protein [Sedimentisphaerales bacterium]